MPAAAAAAPAPHKQHEVRLSFELTEPPVPTFAIVSPPLARGPLSGGTRLVLLVHNLPVAHQSNGWATPGGMQVRFTVHDRPRGAAAVSTVSAPVERVFFSTRASSKVVVTTPPLPAGVAPGIANVSVVLPALMPPLSAVWRRTVASGIVSSPVHFEYRQNDAEDIENLLVRGLE